MHPTVLIPLRHLLMDNAASCGHPLYIAGSDRAMVSHAVAVLNRSGEDISNSLDSSVGVPWKARQVIFGTSLRKSSLPETFELRVLDWRGPSEREAARSTHDCGASGH